LAAELLDKYEDKIEALTLVPSDGGRFELTVNGELLYSKLATHRHVEPGEVELLIGKYIKEAG
jgi:selenoprotein W-related protein